jgi:internalin A
MKMKKAIVILILAGLLAACSEKPSSPENAAPQDTSVSPRNRSVEIAGVEFNTNTTSVDLSETEIEDYSALLGLVNLRNLLLRHNGIDDESIGRLEVLKDHPSLIILDLWYNSINDLSALSGFTSLTGLALGNNNVSDLTPLGGLVNLERLTLGGNSISDITPLGGLVNLKVLALSGNAISDIEPLKGLSGLETLGLTGNPLTQAQIDDLQQALPDCTIHFDQN